MTKRIYRSIVFAVLSVLLAAVALVMGVVYSYFTTVQFSQLRVETALVAHTVANEGMQYFHKLDNTMDCRITWIAQDGTVLYDNRSDSDTMENHLAREEVIDALHSGFGQSSRHSDTLMEQYIYTAERLPDGTVLRLSNTRQSVLRLVLEMLWPVLMIVAGAVALSLWLANRLARQIVRPLNELNLDSPAENPAYSEIQPLLNRLEFQQAQLRLQSQELARRQKEFHTVTRSLPEGLVLLNSSGTILSINPAAAQLLEVNQTCVGTDFSVVNRNPAITQLTETALNGKKAEQIITLKENAYMAAARPVRTEGMLSGIVLLLLDLTQKQKAEALRREFTANVSHELKTPLHSISGYAELLKSGLVRPDDADAFYEKIYNEAQRLIRLVEDILRLSRLDDGPQDLQYCPVELQEEARKVCGNLAAAAELAQVRLEVTGSPVRFRSIPQLLSAILFNLTDNAIKYNRSGGSVQVHTEDIGDCILLSVTDTGIGIPAEHRERIFERFYRVDKSHSKEVGGTGLGLSIVKHAVQVLNGELVLDSASGQGTTVSISFPKNEQAVP